MIVVVGAGVVGLACASAIARRGRAVTVLERLPRPGLGASTRNSGVIHAGLYHPADSLKSRLCVEGRERLYAFAETHRVPHLRCGKLIVAQSGEEARLEVVRQTAAANGVRIDAVDREFVTAREPHVSAAAALWSPHTGWIDADAYVRALAGELARHDGVLLVGTPLVGIESGRDTLIVVTPSERIDAEVVVNAAGLYADEVSAMAGGEAFTIYPCRGEYAELVPRARHMVNGLVYPVPHASGHGLGAHLTKTIGGAVWIGPTIRYQEDKDDYERDRLPIDAFFESARAMLPELSPADLRLAGSGIRAKIHPETVRFEDFLIRRDARNRRLVQVAGIESPGLTASLAIGEMVAGICS